jgi:large subunit ribosomal protein L16
MSKKSTKSGLFAPNLKNKYYSKYHRKLYKKKVFSTNLTSFDATCILEKPTYFIQSLSGFKMNSSLLDLSIKILRKFIKRKGKFRLLCFPCVSYTSKPVQVRMGKGKGPIIWWFFPVKPGSVLFEIIGIDDRAYLLSLVRKLGDKMPAKLRLLDSEG